jgi:hypothetical protein
MNLLYFYIYSKQDFINLFELLLQTAFINSSFDGIEIAIFTLNAYKKQLEEKLNKLKLPIKIITTQQTSFSDFETSYSRYKIFKYYYIAKYTKILFLDLNNIINKDLRLLFDIDIDNDKIYVLEEGTISQEKYGKNLFIDILDLRNSDYDEVSKTTSFNTDIMLFNNSKENEKLFNQILEQINQSNTKEEPLAYAVYNCITNKQYDNQLLKNYVKEEDALTGNTLTGNTLTGNTLTGNTLTGNTLTGNTLENVQETNLEIIHHFSLDDYTTLIPQSLENTYKELFKLSDISEEKNTDANVVEIISVPENEIVKIVERQLSVANARSLENLFEICNNYRITNLSFVECGVGRGGSLSVMKYSSYNNEVFGFDNFGRMPDLSAKDIGFLNKYCPFTDTGKKGDNFSGGIENVEKTFNLLNIPFKNVSLFKGDMSEIVPFHKNKCGKIGVLKIDTLRYHATKTCLLELYDQVVQGGTIIINNYHSRVGVKYALEEFFRNMKLKLDLISLDEDVYFYKGGVQVYKNKPTENKPTENKPTILLNPILSTILNLKYTHSSFGELYFRNSNILEIIDVKGTSSKGIYTIINHNTIQCSLDSKSYLFIFNTNVSAFITIDMNLKKTIGFRN